MTHSSRRKKPLSIFLWHRRAGLLILVLVLLLSISGIFINHAYELELDQARVESSWILNWYGLDPVGSPVTYTVGKHLITSWDDKLFFDVRLIARETKALIGAIRTDEFIVAATSDEIYLINFDGEIVDRMPVNPAITPVQKIGPGNDRAVVSSTGGNVYMADEQLLTWKPVIDENIKWSSAAEPDLHHQQRLLTAWRGDGISIERVLVDVHSGRFFGKYGIYVMDAAAIGLIWLCLSGLWVWWDRRQKSRSKKHYQKHHRT